MNYFLLAETDFFRLINEAGDCNMETAYTAFATQVIELCNGGMDMNLTVIALAYIEIELQHHPVRNLSEEKREIAAYVSKALSFVRKMQKFLAEKEVHEIPPCVLVQFVVQSSESFKIAVDVRFHHIHEDVVHLVISALLRCRLAVSFCHVGKG